MAENSKAWYRPRLRTLLVLLILALVFWSGYSYWSEYMEQLARKQREMMAPREGAFCVVTMDGNERIEGLFSKLNHHWVVLNPVNLPREEIWLSRERIQGMKVGE